MRLACIGIAASVLLCCGCATVPTLLARNNNTSTSVELGDRDEVHEAFGEPTATGLTPKGTAFEEYQIRYGCTSVASENRITTIYSDRQDIRCLFPRLFLINDFNPASLPTDGRNLLVVADIGGVLYIRDFDDKGEMGWNTNESKHPEWAAGFAALRSQIHMLQPRRTEEEDYRVIAAVADILKKAGDESIGTFYLEKATIKRFGVVEVLEPITDRDPEQSDLHYSHSMQSALPRVHPGQILRFEYDKSGRVEQVYADGKFLIGPTTK